MTKPKYKEPIAVSLRPNEFRDPAFPRPNSIRWSAYKTRKWPTRELEPGRLVYGFDKRQSVREFVVLMRIARGGPFTYSSLAELKREVKRLTGQNPNLDDPYGTHIPIPRRGDKPFNGVAVKWKKVKRVSIPWPGNFDQLGWQKLDETAVEPPDDVDPTEAFPEGNRKVRVHQKRERSRPLVKAARQHWRKKQGGRLFCVVCEFDFEREYGAHGAGFIEMHHHTKPLSQARGTQILKVTDLVPLCANCHRMADLKMPPHSLAKVRAARRSTRRRKHA